MRPSECSTMGLEWAYQLAKEPAQLWKRYLVHELPVFLRLMATTSRRSDTAKRDHQPRALEPLPIGIPNDDRSTSKTLEESGTHLA